ncbi:hypothetical protein SALBM217S_09765 [Streptomyces griseoloalbus]
MATEYGQGYGLPTGPGHARGVEGRRHRMPAALRAPVEGRAWRELAYVLLSLPISILLFTYAVTMVSLGAGLLVTFLGVPVLAAALAGCRGFGSVERARARGLLGLDVGEPEPPAAEAAGVHGVGRGGAEERHVLAGAAVLGASAALGGPLLAR